MRRVALLLCLALAGCADGLPESWTLRAPDIELEVSRAPFAFQVRDGEGRVVLRSLADGTGDALAALAWTSGTVSFEPGVISPGHFLFEAAFDPWRDAWVVVAAERGVDELLLEMGAADDPADTGRRIRVRLALRAGALRLEAGKDGRTPRAWSAGFESPAGEGYMGLGERFTRTDFRGLSVYSWAEEGGVGTGEGQPSGPDNPYPNGESMTYYPVPFVLSTGGWAVWLDSTWYNVFALASERPDAWRVWHLGPTLALEILLPGADDGRPWPYRLIDAFTARTGRPLVPPAWAFGPRRRIGIGDQQLGVHELQAMRDLDLALTGADDAVHFLPLGSHVGREAELLAWTDYARSLGVRVCGYYNPYLGDDPESRIPEVLAEGLSGDYFLHTAAGELSHSWLISGRAVDILTVDFTDEAAAAWYRSLFAWAIDLGYSGWMIDFGEYVQPDVLTRSGLSGEEFHNAFPVLYHRAVHDALEASELAGDWLGFVRSGYTGDQAYSPMVWSGDPAASFEDSDGLPSMVRAGINLGVCGVPHWGGDINGFHCASDGYAAADEELLVRWIQQGALTPNMQDQDACSFALDEGRKANIFDDPLAQQAWRTYARLHTRLFPYLYSLAHQAQATGAPLIRHLFLDHPEQPELALVDDAYLLGPALLVAPVVTRGARTKEIDLPAGDYLEWPAGRRLAGGAQVLLDAPLDRLPLLLRAGQLLPLLDPAIDTLAEEDHPDVVGPADVADVYDVVGFLVAGGGSARFELWDGDWLEASWDGGFTAPALAPAADEAELAGCAGCWRRDELSGSLARVRISAPAGALVAGGLRLAASSARRIRWDITLAE